MGFRIVYPTVQKQYGKKYGRVRLPVCIFFFFALFVFLVETMWPEGAVFLERFLPLGEKVSAVSALNNLAEELRLGERLYIAFADCWGNLIS